MAERALITGITGMVGSHLAEYLLEHTDWEIYGLCRWRSPLDNLRELMPRINDRDRVFLVYGDLRDTMSVQRAVAEVWPDYVFHVAAQSYVQTSFHSPLDTLDTNVLGTVRLLDALRLTPKNPLIHVCASSEVFGRVPRSLLPIAEDTPFQPASPYAISKIGTDLVGRFYAEAYGMKVMTTRAFTHAGPRRGDVFAESSFAKQIAMIEAGLLPPVVKVGNLESVRTYLDVRDAVRAYYMLLTVDPVPGAYYNIGGTHSCTVSEMLHVLLAQGIALTPLIRVKVEQDRLRPLDADMQVPDCRKFMEHTGWAPEIPFEKTMADLLEYWRVRVARGDVVLQR